MTVVITDLGYLFMPGHDRSQGRMFSEHCPVMTVHDWARLGMTGHDWACMCRPIMCYIGPSQMDAPRPNYIIFCIRLYAVGDLGERIIHVT